MGEKNGGMEGEWGIVRGWGKRWEGELGIGGGGETPKMGRGEGKGRGNMGGNGGDGENETKWSGSWGYVVKQRKKIRGD